MAGSVHRSHRSHRRTMLASACLLLVIALTACGHGSGNRDGPGRSASPTPPTSPATSGHGQADGPASGGGTPHLSGTYVALGDSFTAAPLAH